MLLLVSTETDETQYSTRVEEGEGAAGLAQSGRHRYILGAGFRRDGGWLDWVSSVGCDV